MRMQGLRFWPVVAAAACVQGESDATFLLWSQQYAAQFTTLVAQVRATFAVYNPNLAVVLGVVSDQEPANLLPYISVVRQQQLAVNIPNVYTVDTEVRR